ncbi:MAG: ABC transporter permease [bacterium]|nr:ABC transporter permease [bacterium]
MANPRAGLERRRARMASAVSVPREEAPNLSKTKKPKTQKNPLRRPTLDMEQPRTYSDVMTPKRSSGYQTFWKSTTRRFLGDRRALLGLCAMGLMIFLALFAPLVAPQEPGEIRIADRFLSPGPGRWLGTDDCGRDVLSRIIYGSRVTLAVGILSVVIYSMVGIVIGMAAGYCGGIIDFLLTRLINVFMCFPSFFLALAALSVVERNVINLVLVISLTGWPSLARIVKTEVKRLMRMEFVSAARMTGAGTTSLLLRHVLPNLAGPVIVAATLGVGGAILIECGLTFIGIGLPHDIPSWGQLLAAGREAIQYAWWLALFPGIAILGSVAGCNMIGESLRDALDPRFGIDGV